MAEQKLDLNSVSAEELTRLPGIGPALAERIVTYRESVHLFESPDQVTAVSGIGNTTYSRIADRLTVAQAEQASVSSLDYPERVSKKAEERSGGFHQEKSAAPPGDPRADSGSEPGKLASEKWESEAAATGREGVSKAQGRPRADVVPGDDRPTREVSSVDQAPSPTLSSPPSERGMSFQGRFSWLWSAMLGGLLGMVFALVVFGGINGSLDIAHSRAVLDIQNRVNDLMADVDSLTGDVDGLRARIDVLEGLAGRMDAVELEVQGLREEAVDLDKRTESLEAEVAAMSDELQVIVDDLAGLQEQAQQTRSFFFGLRTMLTDIFGEAGDGSMPATPDSK